MSVFIAVDSQQQKYVCKLIDLASFERIEREGARDDGLVTGFTNLLKMVQAV